MTGIVQEQGHKLMTINGMPDHIHLLVSMNPKQSPSELMYFVKRSSSLWINENSLINGKFSWQGGFGAFTYAKSQISAVARYIDNQKRHHTRKSFLEEYIELLEAFQVDYENRYLFKPVFY
jgi:REP element-mobilizing transposase RayT